MRSEKDIKEMLRLSEEHLNTLITLSFEGYFEKGMCAAFRCVLEGEPRYTLKELEEKGLILSLDDLKKGIEYNKRLLKFIKEEESLGVKQTGARKD